MVFNANCSKFFRVKPNFLTVYMGSVHREKGGEVKKVVDVIIHEKFSNVFNNLALLKLERMLIYKEEIKPISLTEFEIPEKSEVIISGWGFQQKNKADFPLMMHWDTSSSISKMDCLNSLLISSNDLLCLSHPPEHGMCLGDLGGPAVFEDDLVGIASYISGECGSNRPDIYVKILHHVDWINKNSDY